MLPTIYEVVNLDSGTLSVMAKPVGGEWIEEEFAGLRKLGIDHVVSLLETHEQDEVGLADEESYCQKNEMQYSSFPIPDRGLPRTDKAKSFASELCQEVRDGNHIVIHCRAGIGRTGIIAAAILVHAGYSSTEALQTISEARGIEVPDTDEQAQWVKKVAEHGA